MNLLYLVLASLVVFLATTICFEKKNVWSTIIGAIGVGGVVNSNFFNAADYPIDVFGWSFGVDSIIFTLFIFTVILKYLYWDRKEAYTYSLSAAGAVLFAAIIEVSANAFSSGHSEHIWRKFGGFAVSVIGTIAACVAIIEIMHAIKKKTKIHDFWTVLIALVVATIVNSTIYYGLYSLVTGTEFLLEIMYTSYFGKLIAIGCALLTFGLMKLIERRVNKVQAKKLEEASRKESNT